MTDTSPPAPVAAPRPRTDAIAEAGGSRIGSLQDRVVQAAYAEFQAQHQIVAARAVNLAQQVATTNAQLAQAQAELKEARDALAQALGDNGDA